MFRGEAEKPAAVSEGMGLSSSCRHSSRPASRPRRVPSAWRSGDGAGMDYAQNRVQSAARSSASRACDKIAMMAVEIMIARQTHLSRRARKGLRPPLDLEAGMAKLLAARVAWPMPTTRCRFTVATALRLISRLAHSVRRAHSQHFRGRGGNPGACHRAAVARRYELICCPGNKFGSERLIQSKTHPRYRPRMY